MPPLSTPSSSTSLLFFVSLLLCKEVVSDFTISTPKDFIDFSNNVNNGESYSGTTVYLESDLDFSSLSQKLKPTGNSSNYFAGTFDGQGHVISSLALNSSSHDSVGLFGRTNGMILRNLVLGDTCSIVNSCSPSITIADAAGIIGYCNACTVENTVNMASVAFTGDTTTTLYIGGIAGRLTSTATILNCVNYGSVAHSGTTSSRVGIGGIAGFCGETDSETSILNCANYGTVLYSGSADRMFMGGILGTSWAGTVDIENCVSAGRIINTTQASTANFIGCIVGECLSYATTTIGHCMWTSDIGYDVAYGHDHSSSSTASAPTVTDSASKALDGETANWLNEYAAQKSWSESIVLHLNGGSVNDLTQDTLIATQKQFSEPAKTGYTFSFWCKDDSGECANVYDPETDTTRVTDLYAHYSPNNYTVIFNATGGTPSEPTMNVTYNEAYGTLPEATREGYTFIGWFTEVDGNGDEITDETEVTITDDQVLYAHWMINNYTVTFDFKDGATPTTTKNVTYGEMYGTLPETTKEGHTFIGWFTDENESVTNEAIVKIARNHVLYACWKANTYTITFILNNVESDIIKTINYTDTIDYPESPVKEGYIFAGWSENITTMPAHNLTITAQWSSEYIEIVFGKVDINEEDVEKIVGKYTENGSFTIARFESDSSIGETRVIIKFNHWKDAENFVENINVSSDSDLKKHIIRISLIPEFVESFSFSLYPSLFAGIFI